MHTNFSRSTDNSISTRINRAVTTAFTFAMVGAVGVLTFAQFIAVA